MSWAGRVSLLVTAILCAASSLAAAARIPFGSILAADLDGDRRADFATAGAMRREGAGYLLEIAVRLSAAESRVITVRTPRAAGRIAARDLDGDADRDLILESFDRTPLAIVINDGGGNFHQVSLDEYRARLRRPGHRSVESPGRDSDLPFVGESSAPAADAPPGADSQPGSFRAPRPRPREQRFAAPEYSARASRAPPALL